MIHEGYTNLLRKITSHRPVLKVTVTNPQDVFRKLSPDFFRNRLLLDVALKLIWELFFNVFDESESQGEHPCYM